MEPIVRAVAKDHGQILVCALVKVMAQLMVNGLEVLTRRLDAHLDAHVLEEIDIPCARMAYNFAITRLHEHRTVPEALRQRRESDRCIEAFTRLDHVDRRHLAAFENLRQVVTGICVSGCNHGINISPILSPNVAEKMRRERTICRNDVAVPGAKL